MSVCRPLAAFGVTCASIAALACAAPGLAQAQCPQPGCTPPPPEPQILTISGTEGTQSLTTFYGGTSELLVNGWYPNQPSPPPPVTFTARLTNSTAPVRVIATDELWCIDASYAYYTYTFSHDSAPGNGTASVTFQPTISCPAGQMLAESAQVGQAQLPSGTFTKTTPTVTFAWKGLGYCSNCT
jgi:hypothetical protein